MMYKAKVAVCSDIRTKHWTQNERHVEFLNVKPWWYVKKPLGFKRLNYNLIDCNLNVWDTQSASYFLLLLALWLFEVMQRGSVNRVWIFLT